MLQSSQRNEQSCYFRKKNMVSDVIEELKILTELDNSPFIVKVYEAFQDEKNLYLMLEYCSGGELEFNLPSWQNGILPTQAVLFYAAELVVSLTNLHKHHIIHRDLKPNNILLDPEGHIVLIDFWTCTSM